MQYSVFCVFGVFCAIANGLASNPCGSQIKFNMGQIAWAEGPEGLSAPGFDREPDILDESLMPVEKWLGDMSFFSPRSLEMCEWFDAIWYCSAI